MYPTCLFNKPSLCTHYYTEYREKLKNKRKTITDYGKWPRSLGKGNRKTHIQKQGCTRNFKEVK